MLGQEASSLIGSRESNCYLLGFPYYGVGYALDFTRCGAIFKRPHTAPMYGVRSTDPTVAMQQHFTSSHFFSKTTGAKEPRPKKLLLAELPLEKRSSQAFPQQRNSHW